MAKKKIITKKSKTKKVVKKLKKVLVRKKVIKKKVAKKKIIKKKVAKKKIVKKVKKKVIKKVVKKIKVKKKARVIKKVVKRAVKKIVKKTPKPLLVKVLPRKKKRRAVVKENKENFLAESFFKAKIKVIGIGGGGGSIVSEIGRSLHKATFVVADTDVRAFKKRQGIKYFLFGQKLTHGLGTGVNPELGRQAAEAEKERIAQLFTDQDIVILIGSLGGGLASGATQVFAEAAKNFNGITFGIFTLPFKFEGNNKYKIALKALGGLRKSLNVSITLPNEKIFKIIDANTAITDAFSIVNKHLIEGLESLIDLIYNPGIINIDFADLRSILKGRGNLAFLNTAEASGKNRAEEIAQKILHNPLYQTTSFPSEKILFNVEGGANLSMFEVDKISKAISEKNPKAKIIFGISKDASLKNKIKTTLLMTGGGTNIEVIEPAIIPKVVIKKPVEVVVPVVEKKVVKKKKKVKRKIKPVAPRSLPEPEILPFPDAVPIFNGVVGEPQMAEPSLKKIDVIEIPTRPKKAIRRSALEIRKAQDQEENKQSLQEKEWEIPAFLRIKK